MWSFLTKPSQGWLGSHDDTLRRLKENVLSAADDWKKSEINMDDAESRVGVNKESMNAYKKAVKIADEKEKIYLNKKSKYNMTKKNIRKRNFTDQSLIRELGSNNDDISVDISTQDALDYVKQNYTGAKCDSEGFYQHSGECWNDAIQMVFLWTDGLKEVVQEKLAKSEIKTIDNSFIPYPDLIRKNFELLIKIEEHTPYKAFMAYLYRKFKSPSLLKRYVIKDALLYFKSLQNRFARHYYSETRRRESESVCPIIKPIDRLFKIHTKGRNAIRGATFGNPYRKTLHKADYTPMGANPQEEFYLMNLFFDTFFTTIDAELNMYKRKNNLLLETVWIKDNTDNYSKLRYIDTNKDILAILLNSYIREKNTGGHTSCFYTCGNIDFFYEDNHGPFIFPWRKCISDDSFIDIKNIVFGQLYINSKLFSHYYPIIETSDKYLIYHNNSSKLIYKESIITKDPETYSIDIKTEKEFIHKNWFINGIEYTIIMYLKHIDTVYLYTPIFMDKGTKRLNISNKGFQFREDVRYKKTVLGGMQKKNKTLKNK